MEVPNGWYEMSRGPRPPSVRWPLVSHGQPSQPRRIFRHFSPHTRAIQFSDLARCAVATEAARARVTALEAAISALGSSDGAALKSLHEGFAEGQTIYPSSSSWGAIGRVPPNHRACQEVASRFEALRTDRLHSRCAHPRCTSPHHACIRPPRQ